MKLVTWMFLGKGTGLTVVEVEETYFSLGLLYHVYILPIQIITQKKMQNSKREWKREKQFS